MRRNQSNNNLTNAQLNVLSFVLDARYISKTDVARWPQALVNQVKKPLAAFVTAAEKLRISRGVHHGSTTEADDELADQAVGYFLALKATLLSFELVTEKRPRPGVKDLLSQDEGQIKAFLQESNAISGLLSGPAARR